MSNTTLKNLAVYISYELNKVISFTNENILLYPNIDTNLSDDISIRVSTDNSIMDIITGNVENTGSLVIRLSNEEEILSTEIQGVVAGVIEKDISLNSRLSIITDEVNLDFASLTNRLSNEEDERENEDQQLISKITLNINDLIDERNSLIISSIDSIKNGSPSTLDTLSEIADAVINNQDNLSDILSNQTSILNKVSTNTFNRLNKDTSTDNRLNEYGEQYNQTTSELITRLDDIENSNINDINLLNTLISINVEQRENSIISLTNVSNIHLDRLSIQVSIFDSSVNSIQEKISTLNSIRVQTINSLNTTIPYYDAILTQRINNFNLIYSNQFQSLSNRINQISSIRQLSDPPIVQTLFSLQERVSIDEISKQDYIVTVGTPDEYSVEFRDGTLPLVSGREVEVGTNFFTQNREQIYGKLYDVLFDNTGFFAFEIFDIGINKIQLSGQYNITSERNFIQSKTVVDLNTSLLDGFFKPDGTKFYGLVRSGQVWEWDLTNPWDLHSMVFLRKTNLLPHGTLPISIDFNSGGTKLFYSERVSKKIYEYDVVLPWNVMSINYTGSNTVLQSSEILSVKTVYDNNKVFVARKLDNGDRIFDEYVIGGVSINNTEQFYSLPVTDIDTEMEVITMVPNGQKFIGVSHKNNVAYNLSTNNVFSLNQLNLTDTVDLLLPDLTFINGTFRVDTFLGDGENTIITLTGLPTHIISLDVNGVNQQYGVQYTIDMYTITFNSSIPKDYEITVRYIGYENDGDKFYSEQISPVFNFETFKSDGNTMSYTPLKTLSEELYIDINGVIQHKGYDYLILNNVVLFSSKIPRNYKVNVSYVGYENDRQRILSNKLKEYIFTEDFHGGQNIYYITNRVDYIILVSINGVISRENDDYTIENNTLTFKNVIPPNYKIKIKYFSKN